MERISTKLTLIVLLHLFLLLLNGWFLYYQLERVEDDAQVINQAGLVRGLTQRIAKLEAGGVAATALIKKTESVLKELEGHTDDFSVIESDKRFAEGLREIRTAWEKQRKLIAAYRKSKKRNNRVQLVQHSETLWKLTNNFVFLSQEIAEAKHGAFRLVFFILSIDVLVICFIVWMIRSIVRGKLEVAAAFDKLTGVYNRGVHDQMLGKAVEAAHRYEKDLSYLMMDIDHFKRLNDRHGHDVGDLALKTLAAAALKEIRSSDALCRVGGEEFAVLMPETEQEQALQVAERIRAAAEKCMRGKLPPITVSVGVATLKEKETTQRLYKRADALMYHAKDAGRNRIQGE